jgi:hypothetical protein
MRSQVVAVVGVAALAALSACSSSSKSSSTAATTTIPATTTTAAPTSATLQAKLLKASDIGTQFTDGQYTASNPSDPAPCGGQSADAQVPPTLKVGSEIDLASPQAALVEEISVFSDATTAASNFADGLKNVSCASGTVGTGATAVKINFTTPQDVTSQTGGEQAKLINFTSAQFTGGVIGILSGDEVISFQFQVVAGAPTTTLPDTVTVAKQGFTRATS